MFEKAPNNINVTLKRLESLSLFTFLSQLAVKINSIRFFYPIKRMIYQLLYLLYKLVLHPSAIILFFFCFERGSYIQAGIGLKQVTYLHNAFPLKTLS